MTMHTKLPISASDLGYVVEKGKHRSVILGINKFRSLMEFIEYLEDSMELKRAKDEATGFEDFDIFLKELRKEELF